MCAGKNSLFQHAHNFMKYRSIIRFRDFILSCVCCSRNALPEKFVRQEEKLQEEANDEGQVYEDQGSEERSNSVSSSHSR